MKDEGYKSFWREKREYHTDNCGLFFEIKSVLYAQNSKFQRIEVVENEYFGRILFLDGLVQTTERDEYFYHEMLVHPAFLTHPQPRRVLVIGGGDGGVVKEVLRYPVEKVDFVEIDEEVIRVCQKYFPWLKKVLQDKRVELVLTDGFEFIQQAKESYDIILVDSSEPVGPSVSLHEKKFYQRLRDNLSQPGIVVAQMGSPFFHQDELFRKFEFLRTIFKKVFFYTGPVPTYPAGEWSYAFLSETIDPTQILREPPGGLKFYNRQAHQRAFLLPKPLEKLRQDLA